MMRLYLDNQLISFLLRHDQGNAVDNAKVQEQTNALVTVLARSNVEVLVSEESLAEIRKMPHPNDHEEYYYKLKQGKSVIRNSAVLVDDQIATLDSPDVFLNHQYTDDDLNLVKQFLATRNTARGYDPDFDARYIANAMLPENHIDTFVTFDMKTIWRHRKDIAREFRLDVKLPSEL